MPVRLLLILALLAAPASPVLPAAAPARAQTAQDSGSTLAQLLQRGEMHYPDYRGAQITYNAAREEIPLARAVLRPQASAAVSAENSKRDGSTWRGNLSIAHDFYNAPNQRLLQAAEAQTAAAAINLAAARQALRRDIILAWLDAQRAAEVLLLVETRRKTLRAQLARARLRAASGEVIQADVLSAQAQLANADAQWAQAKHDLAVMHDILIRYTGAAAAPRRLSPRPLPPLPPLLLWQKRAAAGNLSLAAARQNTRVVHRRLQAAEGAVAPVISVSGGLSAEQDNSGIGRNVQIQIRQPLYTGGNLRARQRQLIAESDLAHEQVAAVQLQVRQEVRRLHGQLRADLSRLRALAEAAAAAEALLQVVTIGYENGVNIIAEVLNAEEELFDAQVSLRQTRYGYLKNRTAVFALMAAADNTFVRGIEQFFTPPDAPQSAQPSGEGDN